MAWIALNIIDFLERSRVTIGSIAVNIAEIGFCKDNLLQNRVQDCSL